MWCRCNSTSNNITLLVLCLLSQFMFLLISTIIHKLHSLHNPFQYNIEWCPAELRHTRMFTVAKEECSDVSEDVVQQQRVYNGHLWRGECLLYDRCGTQIGTKVKPVMRKTCCHGNSFTYVQWCDVDATRPQIILRSLYCACWASLCFQ